jgi:sugar/nucleoside kinase (ribokinase family)
MKGTFDVVTMGAATVDAFVWSKAFRTVKSDVFPTGVGECFSLGSKIEIDHFSITTGGGATNAATTFRRLGFRSACIAAVGDDLFGTAIMRALKEEKISTTCVQTIPKKQTAFSTILVTPSGERTVLVARGVSEHVMPAKIPWARLSGEWLYATSLAGNLSLAKSVFGQAKKKGMRLFWNPGAKDIAHGIHHLKPLLCSLAVLDMNREEAARLTGRTLGDIPGMLADLTRLGTPLVLLTDGDKGAFLAEKERVWFAKPTGARAINRTGAGDAFGSGFLAGMIRFGDVTRALQLGTLNAEGVIRNIGAKTGLLRAWPKATALLKVKVRAV